MNDSSAQLHARWSKLWRELGVAADRVPKIDSLLHAYESPSRAYHNLTHIRQCLAELDRIRECLREPR